MAQSLELAIDLMSISSTPVRVLLALALGILLGLLYGWLIRPVEYVNTTPNSLRADYRTDYVLMVAETTTRPQDLDQAQRRLGALGPQAPADIVQQALDYAKANHFSTQDIDKLQALQKAFESVKASPEIGGP